MVAIFRCAVYEWQLGVQAWREVLSPRLPILATYWRLNILKLSLVADRHFETKTMHLKGNLLILSFSRRPQMTFYFPMQKVEKMSPRTSSGVVWPVSESRAQSAR